MCGEARIVNADKRAGVEGTNGMGLKNTGNYVGDKGGAVTSNEEAM